MFDFYGDDVAGLFFPVLLIAWVFGALGHATSGAIRRRLGKEEGAWNEWTPPPAVIMIAPIVGSFLGFHYGGGFYDGWVAASLFAFLFGAVAHLVYGGH